MRIYESNPQKILDAGPVLRQMERPLVGDEMAGELLLEMFEVGTEQLLLGMIGEGTGIAAKVFKQ